MRRTLKILLVVVVSVLLVVLLGVTWIILDEDPLRSWLEGYVSKTTGRTLTMADLEIDLGRNTEIRVDLVNLENADWAATRSLLRVEKLDCSLDLWALLKGQVVIIRLELDGVEINLEENQDNQPNWEVWQASAEREPGEQKLAIPFNNLEISNLQLTHAAPERSAPLVLHIDDLGAEISGEDRIDVSANGLLGGYPLELDVFVLPVNSLTEGGPLEYELQFSLGQVLLNSAGSFQNIRTGAGASVEAQFRGPEIEWVLEQAAIPKFSEGSFDAHVQLEINDDESLALELDGDFGSLQVTASGQLEQLRDPSHFDLLFSLAGPDLKALGETFGVDNLPAASFTASGDVRRNNQLIFVERFEAEIGLDQFSAAGTVGPWPGLEETSLQLTGSGPEIRDWGPLMQFDSWLSSPFAFQGDLAPIDGKLEIRAAGFSLGQNRLEIDGVLGKAPDFIGSSMDISMDLVDIGKVVDPDLTGNLPAIPAGLNGTIHRTSEGIQLENVRLHSQDNHVAVTGQVLLNNVQPGGDWHSKISGSRIESSVSFPSLAYIGGLVAVEELPDEPLEMHVVAQLERAGLNLEIRNATLGDIGFDLKGLLPGVSNLDQSKIDFGVSAPDLDAISDFVDVSAVPRHPVSVRGTLRPDTDSIVFESMSGQFGSAGFDVKGEMSTKPEFALKSAQFSVAGPNFRDFHDHPALEDMSGDFEIVGDIENAGDHLRIEALSIRFSQAQLRLSGEIADLSSTDRFDLDLNFSAREPQEFNKLLAKLGDHDFPAEPISFAAKAERDGDDFVFNDASFSWGNSEFQGTFHLGVGDIPVYRGQFNSQRLDLSWLSDQDEDDPAGTDSSADPSSADSGTPPQTGKVFSDEPIPLISIDPVIVDLAFRADAIDLPNGSRMQAVNVGFNLTENGLVLDPFEMTDASGGRLAGSLSVEKVDGKYDSEIKATANGFRTGLMAAPNQEPSTYPASDVSVDIKARGVSLHELASSANGELEVIISEGKIANSRIDLLFTDMLSQLVTMLNPFVKTNEFTGLDCGVIQAKLVDGLATVNPLIIQTTELIVISEGQISLEAESIDLGFNTRPRKGIGLSTGMVINPFIKLGGTLGRPSISLDKQSAAVTGGAAVMTSGLSLIGKSLFDRYLRGSDPCGKIVEELSKTDP